jgi:hypothetical protein
MRRALVFGLVAVALLVGGAAVGSTIPPHRPPWQTRPCPVEDSVNCYWNAARQGNGYGDSFFVVRRHLEGRHGQVIGRVVCVYYSDRFARHHYDACHLLNWSPMMRWRLNH